MFQLGVAQLDLLVGFTDEQLEQSHTIPSTGETKAVEDMTVKELREVKKALKQAESKVSKLEEEAARARESAEAAIAEKGNLQLKIDSERTEIKQTAREAAKREFDKRERDLRTRIEYLETNPTIIERESPELKDEIKRLKGELARFDDISADLADHYALVDELREELEVAKSASDRSSIESELDAKTAEIDSLRKQLDELTNPRNVWGMLKQDRVAGLTNETHTHTIRWAEKISQTLLLSEEGVSVAGIAADMHLETIATVERVLAKLKQIRVESDEEVVGNVEIEPVAQPTRWLKSTDDVRVIG